MRIVSLDIGEVRIGVAACDEMEIAAYPISTIRRVGSLKRDVEAVMRAVREQEAETILVGLPLSLDGGVGPQAERVKGFAKALGAAAGVPIVFWDESLTSVEANEIMIAQGVSRAKRREKIDQVAAVLILESYLRQRSSGLGGASQAGGR
jgi:putative Holliday junction resolvase